MVMDMVFFQSDASLKQDGTAIIAIQDSYDGKIYQEVIETRSSLEAEEHAMIFAINIAITKEYRHIVLVYDCLAINTDTIKKMYKKNFETLQFLWVKRRHIAFIDALTKNEASSYQLKLRGMSENELDRMVIRELSNYVETFEEVGVFRKIYKKRSYHVTNKNKRIILLNLLYFLSGKGTRKILKKAFSTFFTKRELNQIYALKRNSEYRGVVRQLGIQSRLIEEMIKYRGIKKRCFTKGKEKKCQLAERSGKR